MINIFASDGGGGKTDVGALDFLCFTIITIMIIMIMAIVIYPIRVCCK